MLRGLLGVLRPIDVRWTSVGRPTDVRRMSVGRPYGRPYRRGTSDGRPYGRPLDVLTVRTDVHTDVRMESMDIQWTSVRTSDGRPWDVCMDVPRISVQTSVGRPSDVRRTSDGRPSDDVGRPLDVCQTCVGRASDVRPTFVGHPLDVQRRFLKNKLYPCMNKVRNKIRSVEC